MMRKLFVILTMLAALLVASVGLAAAPSLMDKAHVLTAEQKKEVLTELHKQEQAHGIRMGVVIMQSINGADTGKYANKLIDDVYNDGANGNMVLLQVLDTRKWYISTDKKLKEVIQGDAGVEYMSRPMVAKLKNGDYAGAYITYAQRGGELLSHKEDTGEAWTPESEEEDEFNWMALFIALVGGCVIAGGYRTTLISSMSNVRSQVAANAYLNKDTFTLTKQDDIYTHTTVAAVPKPKNNRDDDDNDGGVSDHGSDGGHGGGGGGY